MTFNVALPFSASLLFIFCASRAIFSAHALSLSGRAVGHTRSANLSTRTEELHHPQLKHALKKKKKGGRTVEAPWKVVDMECGVTHKMTSSGKMDEFCAPECPYFAQDRLDDTHCTFVCVTKPDCFLWNPNKPIPDFKLGSCRAPNVNHCKTYVLDGTDTCKVCQSLFEVGEDGQCHYQYYFLLYILLAVFVTIVIFLIVWVVDLIRRPITNQTGLDTGLHFRSNQKLRQPKSGDGHRVIWPITTNLTKVDVAGPGMMLHFNFQKCVIIWALIVGLIWTVLALVVDTDLFIIGTKKFGTPRDNCILVAWGYETQQRLMWTKVLFLAIVYVVSFVLCLLHGVIQLRHFQKFQHDNTTFKDFAALCVGLPSLPGSDKVEEELKNAIMEATGEKVVGVSVCWDFKDEDELIQKAVHQRIDALQKRYNDNTQVGPSAPDADEPSALGPFHHKLFDMEQSIFGADGEERESDADRDKRDKDLLHNTTSTSYAYVVFETEHGRNAAVKQVAQAGFQYGANTVKLEVRDDEPDTVLWSNFGHTTIWHTIGRFAIGFGCILLALTFWTTVFYAPYAWSVMNFNYDNGQEPGFVYSISFSMVVVVGNAIMYEVCNRVSVFIGFRNNDNRESCYMILYTIACTFNIMMDMITTYFIALYVMQGRDFRTYDGTRLAELTKFHDQFDTYAMQRSLAQNTFGYAFPSTFLIPFLIEPFATIVLPYMIGQWLVRSHPEMVGRTAEEWLTAAPMDLGRYGDLMLNIVLGILIFYFPGGYTHSLFFAMAVSHLYIYAFDHVKVLTVIPSCTYANMRIDWWAQAMFAPCCGLILSCLVFKSNCQGYGFCIDGARLIEICTGVFLAHSVLHLLLLTYLVPIFGHPEPENPTSGSYIEHATGSPANWFVTNPVHCLRSRLIYNQQPPVTFYECGKAHLMEVNKEYACYFQDSETWADEEAREVQARENMKSISKRISSMWR